MTVGRFHQNARFGLGSRLAVKDAYFVIGEVKLGNFRIKIHQRFAQCGIQSRNRTVTLCRFEDIAIVNRQLHRCQSVAAIVLLLAVDLKAIDLEKPRTFPQRLEH